MPRRPDYAAHFALAREAAFAVVLEHGVAHLSRRSVAQQMGVSLGVILRLVAPECPMERLAADQVEQRRRVGRLFVPRGEPFEVATRLAARLVPESDDRRDEELVWLRLVTAARPGEVTLDHHRAAHQTSVETTIGTVLERLAVPEEDRVAAGLTLHALADGLTFAVCTGRMPVDGAQAVMHAHLRRCTA